METNISPRLPDCDEWIVVGSSPSAPEWLERLQGTPGARTITTNRGIELFADKRPDVYFLGGELLTEGDAFDEQVAAGRRVRAKGTRVIGLSRSPAVNDEWDIGWLDEFLIMELGCWRPWKFIPGKYTACRLSGLFCLQYAVNHGATRIHLVGMEGYSQDGEHYFNQGEGVEDSQAAIVDDVTRDVIEPFVQAIINVSPGVEFLFYGNLEYKPHGQNVTVVSEKTVSGEPPVQGAGAWQGGETPWPDPKDGGATP